MTVLPIVERELRLAARRGTTYWTRLGVASAAILVGTVVFLFTFGLPPAQTGRYIFQWLAGLLLVYCLAYGRRSTADCLSQENREGTLGLLFLTDLKGHDVVLGKLVATSVHGFYGLLAVFPVLAAPLLLGGITSGEFWRVVLVLMDTFLFSLAIGMLGSALSRELGRAMAANLTLLLLLMAMPPACMYALGYFAPGLRPIPQLLFSCPAYAFYLCHDIHYKAAADHFWWSVAVMHGLTWLLVLTAAWIVPRSWQDRPSRAEKGRWRGLWHAWRHGPVAGKSAFRRRTLDANAFYWLAARARFKPVHVWTFLGCMAGWWLVCRLVLGRVWLDPSVAVLTALLLNSALKVWLVIEAGQQLAEDQRTGAFELLLSSPLTVRDILRGQLLALRRQFLGPLLVVLGVELLLMLGVPRRAYDWETLATWSAGMSMLVADLVALSWVAMWHALVAKSHNLATVSTLTRVLVFPWFLFGAVMGVGNLWAGLVRGREWSPGWEFTLALWVGLGLATDVLFGLMAWWQLRTRFRELALRRFNPGRSRFARWFGQQSGHAGLHHAGAATEKGYPDRPQSRDERGEGKGIRTSALFASLRLNLRSGTPRRRLALFGIVALVVVGVTAIALRSRSNPPPPIFVFLAQSNGPVRVFSGPDGVVLILPDGSPWRWGRAGAANRSRVAVPEQLGTNHNWVQAAGGYGHWIGLRQDGSLWEWGYRIWNTGPTAGFSSEPMPVDLTHVWTGIAAGITHSVALRRDGTLWAWGDNSMGQLGNGPGPTQTTPVQVGTDADWAAVCCAQSSTLAVRRDGTLWTWGWVLVGGTGSMSVRNLFSLTRVCLESNWTGFISGGVLPLVRNRSGELWEPFRAAPNAEASAAANCLLVASNSAPGHFASAYCGEARIYELRSDGTLWERAQPLGYSASAPVGDWRRVGKRADWVGLWGAHGTALGLTADGTLWTWGIDAGREPAFDLLSRLKLARSWLTSLIGPRPRPTFAGVTPAHQNLPRPLMRLVLTNSVPPARPRDVGR